MTPEDCDNSQPPKLKRESCSSSIQEVEEVIKKLREKHSSKYSTEKLSAWAHLVQMGKHT